MSASAAQKERASRRNKKAVEELVESAKGLTLGTGLATLAVGGIQAYQKLKSKPGTAAAKRSWADIGKNALVAGGVGAAISGAGLGLLSGVNYASDVADEKITNLANKGVGAQVNAKMKRMLDADYPKDPTVVATKMSFKNRLKSAAWGALDKAKTIAKVSAAPVAAAAASGLMAYGMASIGVPPAKADKVGNARGRKVRAALTAASAAYSGAKVAEWQNRAAKNISNHETVAGVFDAAAKYQRAQVDARKANIKNVTPGAAPSISRELVQQSPTRRKFVKKLVAKADLLASFA